MYCINVCREAHASSLTPFPRASMAPAPPGWWQQLWSCTNDPCSPGQPEPLPTGHRPPGAGLPTLWVYRPASGCGGKQANTVRPEPEHPRPRGTGTKGNGIKHCQTEPEKLKSNKSSFSCTPQQGRKLGTPSADLAVCSVIPATGRKTVRSKSCLRPSAISPSI